MMVLLIVGGVFLLGAGSCLVLGGLMVLGASEAENDGPNVPPITSASAAPPASTPAPTAAGDKTPPLQPTTASQSTAGRSASGGGAPSPRPGGGVYSCTATGTARMCGPTNICTNQFVTGYGSGSDQASASNSARVACQGQIVARGGSGGCSVACSHRAQ